MHTRHDSLLVLAIVAVLAAVGFVAYNGELTLQMNFTNSMIAFHFFEFVLSIVFLVFIYKMSRTHSHHRVRSIFSANFLYMNLGMLVFVLSTAWYLYTFVAPGFGMEYSPEMIHLVGSSGVIISMVLIVKGVHKIYKDMVIKM